MKRKFELISFFFFRSSISCKIDHNDSNDDNFSLYIEIEFNSTDIPFSYRANDTSNIVRPIIDFFLSFFQSVVAIAIFIEVNITPLENEERRIFLSTISKPKIHNCISFMKVKINWKKTRMDFQ